MALVIKGKHAYNFKNKENQQISGIQLHCLQQHPSPTEGYLVEVLSIVWTKPIYPMAEQLPLESVITPIYNKYGKIEDIVLVSKPGDEKK